MRLGGGVVVIPLDDGGAIAGLHAGVLGGRLGSRRCHVRYGVKRGVPLVIVVKECCGKPPNKKSRGYNEMNRF